jgi:hypothetical protein
MLRCLTLVRTELSEERISSIIRVKIVGELGRSFALISNRCTMLAESYLLDDGGETFLRV